MNIPYIYTSDEHYVFHTVKVSFHLKKGMCCGIYIVLVKGKLATMDPVIFLVLKPKNVTPIAVLA